MFRKHSKMQYKVSHSEMCKTLKTILIIAYSALFIKFLRNITANQTNVAIELNYLIRSPGIVKNLHRELKKYRKNVTIVNTNYKRPLRLQTDLKFILKWTEAFSHYSSSIFRNGQGPFLDYNCTYYNCYMTNDKSLLVDLRNFDAILFDVENNWDTHPMVRVPDQTYIFTASESASNYPICHPYYDAYYNLTWTYKLDSDIRWSYITILDKNGKFVGPKVNMTWKDLSMEHPSEEVISKLVDKKKTAAWFVSNCNTRSGRENLTKNLVDALDKYGLTIDIYGFCGKLKCPRDRLGDCLELLENNYYFYLAFENSLSDDYVTEKILYPLQHYTVPVVYGGANYSRFLPPGSYINAGELEPHAIASLMIEAMRNPKLYQSYFRWHNHYVYKESPEVADVCNLCMLLNKHKTYQKHSVVRNFRRWWNPNYAMLCKEELKIFTNI